MRYELTDYEWTAIKPFLPNKPRGVPRVNGAAIHLGSDAAGRPVVLPASGAAGTAQALC